MTKTQAAANRTEYRMALLDGRVVRYNGGQSFTAFNTVADALQAIAVAKHNGFPAELVTMTEAERRAIEGNGYVGSSR
jgi:hypothetical protein